LEGKPDRRGARRQAERRSRARRRRRNVLALIALVSLGVGVAVGAGHESSGGGKSGSSSEASAVKASKDASGPKLAAGGLGPVPPQTKLVSSQGPVPILMYHVIASPPASAQLPELYVDPKDFDAQMGWLKSQGYQGVSLNQVYDAWFRGGQLPEKPVVVSFDDGYRGQYVYARPELRKLHWPGVLNLISGRVGQPGAELSVAMVQRMIDDGWELDDHTIHHVDVSQLSGAQLQLEIGGSRKDLQRRFHQPVNFFCYPSGRYDDQAIAAVRAAGYLGATTTNEGLASKRQMYTLDRIRVDFSDGVSGLAQKLQQAGG
jgi:peptidoglycan/xylan/chitin deacetylase (PgdA/CDA1 family)